MGATTTSAVPTAAPLVYLVTDRHATGGRPLADVLELALTALAGARIPRSAVAVQVREKDLGGRALLELARDLRAVTSAAGTRLFINDRVDVALAVAADGVHLGGGALAPGEVRLVAPDLTIALSTHRPEEVARAAAAGDVSFVVFGPVFDTPSKRALGRPQGLSALRAACAFPIPVLALGGVQADQIPECFRAGTSGVALIRAVLAQPDPAGALRAIFRAIEST